MNPLLLLRCAAWLLGATAAIGAWMAVLRFGHDRAPPRLLRGLHGMLALSGLGLLVFGWATAELPPLGVVATVLLVVAVAGGLSVRLGNRRPWAPTVETWVFVHFSVAATGYLLLLVAVMTKG